MHRNIFAHTAPGSTYPEFVSVNATDDPDRITIAVRSPAGPDGSCGNLATITLTSAEMLALANAIKARTTDARAFDAADFFWRTMDPDDNGDNPGEALHRGMIGLFTVCEVASSYSGPTRYGFNAPVLDPESDDEEFLHFATQAEALAGASERKAALAEPGVAA